MRPTVPIGGGAPSQLLPGLPISDGTPDGAEGGMTDLETGGRKPLKMAAGPGQMGIGAQTQAASIKSCETSMSRRKGSEIISRHNTADVDGDRW